MSLNIKIEPFEESSSIVDLSSDEDDLVSEQIEIPEIRQSVERPRTPDSHCSICLEELTNKCHSDVCWHLFCFECLKRWSAIESSCPLCKKNFKSIHHTLAGLRETYEVPIQERELSPRIFVRPFGDISDVNRIFRMNLFLDIVRRNERLMNNIHTSSNLNFQDHNHNLTFQLLNYAPSSFDLLNPYVGGPRRTYGQAMRIQVYTDNVWAEPLPDLSGRYRDCTSTFYRNNPTQSHRLHEFIVRDVTAIRSLQRPDDMNRLTEFNFNEEVITNLIIQSVPLYEIRDPIMTGMLRPYLGDHAAHFCHELYNFANSPYDIIGYDRNVRYSIRQGYSPFHQQPGFHATDMLDQVPTAIPIPGIFNHSETIVLDSDDDEIIETGTRRFPQEIIVLSSSSEDSDIEIISHSFCPIEILDSPSRDQPSTSTGIRDSLDRPNNRYNLRRRRFISPIESPSGPVHQLAYSPSLRRERIILDSSSSDESITSNRDNPGVMVYGRRKRKIKKSKHKKRKTNSDDTRPEILRTGTRSRSYSGSSSSSGGTDTSPNNNNCVSVQTNVVM